jgi:hypothetical protein
MTSLEATSVIDWSALTERFEMPDPRIGRNDDTGPCDMSTPTEIKIFAVKAELRVKATECFEQVGAHECDAPLQVENITNRVELFLIEITALHERRGLTKVIA